jgi:Tol biopolymer transport system component
VRLGEGEPRSFSRDGKWLLATVPAEPPKVILYGVDEEQKKTVDTGSLQVRQVALSPDAKQVFLASQPPNGPMEFYLQDVESGRRERLPLDAPPGTSTPQFSPDATRISMITPSGGFVYDLRTHGMRTLPLRRGEQIAEWTDDGRALWVYSSEASALALDRLDLATGARTHVTDLSVDRTGAMGSSFLHTTPDGKTVVYEVVRSLTDLFVVKGLR